MKNFDISTVLSIESVYVHTMLRTVELYFIKKYLIIEASPISSVGRQCVPCAEVLS